MKKYWSVFKISFAQEFTYKLNFVMWRVRNIMQILVFYFLWNAAFENRNEDLFGYDKSGILTYAFLLVFVRAVSLSSRSADVAGQISSGELSNFLLKPFNFFKYWLTRDVSSKLLNIIFALFEILILYLVLKPPFLLQTNPVNIIFFVISLLVSMFIFFNILMLTSFVPFWAPEVAWGAQFLVVVIVVEFLSGAFFPLDVFPKIVYSILQLTPFPYLIFVPIKIYLGNFDVLTAAKSLLIGIFWCFLLWQIMLKVWGKGLKVYESAGR